MLAYTSLIFAALGESFVPLLYGQVIDAIAIAPDMQRFRTYMLALIGTALATGVFTGLRGSTFIVLGGRFGKRLRLRLFESLLAQASPRHAAPVCAARSVVIAALRRGVAPAAAGHPHRLPMSGPVPRACARARAAVPVHPHGSVLSPLSPLSPLCPLCPLSTRARARLCSYALPGARLFWRH